jgi:hypothetical protein
LITPAKRGQGRKSKASPETHILPQSGASKGLNGYCNTQGFWRKGPLFILYPVQYLNVKRNLDRFVSGNAVPATPKQIPGTALFSFVHRQTNEEVWIKSFNPETFAITPITAITGDNSDYAWAPNGDIFRAEENVLYVWKKGGESDRWTKVQEMSEMFKGVIYRLAISPDGKKIALVENR